MTSNIGTCYGIAKKSRLRYVKKTTVKIILDFRIQFSILFLNIEMIGVLFD